MLSKINPIRFKKTPNLSSYLSFIAYAMYDAKCKYKLKSISKEIRNRVCERERRTT